MPPHRVPLTLLDPDGGWVNAPVHVSELHNRPVLLHFWSTNCKCCKEQLPSLNKLIAEFEPQGLRVIGVHVPLDENEAALDTNVIEAEARRLNLKHPIAVDDGSMAQAYGVKAIPAFLVFDANPELRHQVSGEKAMGHLRSALERALEEKPHEPHGDITASAP